MNWLKKIAQNKITKLFQHGNVYGFFAYKFPKYIEQIKDLIVVEIDENEWEQNSFTGYGYFITQNNIDNIKQNLSNTSPQIIEMYKKQPLRSEIKRDILIHELYQKFNQAPFFIIKPGNESYLIHEGAHQLWELIEDRDSISLPELNPEDGDQYMQSKSERFAYMTEMEYFKAQGKSFDDYFQQSFPDSAEILNDAFADENNKKLALLDYKDHKQIWDYI